MGFLSWLFGSRARATTAAARDTTTRTTTYQSPFSIDAPSIGFLNLRGSVGEKAMQEDSQILSALFAERKMSRDIVPSCSVLFLYCDLDEDGQIFGHAQRIRGLIMSAGAYIAVIASENAPASYMKCLGKRDDWSANIVLTIDRKGDILAQFFAKLFRQMYAGKSMLMAWVELAPQIPDHDHPDAPATIMAAEAGHLVFKNT